MDQLTLPMTPVERQLPEIDIRHCDFRTLDIAPDSVDLVFTDPPYPKEYLPLWADLAQFAYRVLRPGHLLITYSGLIVLPEVIKQLGRHLTYIWCGAIHLPGSSPRIWSRRILHAWRPLLMYAKGNYEPGRWITDFTVSGGREKLLHPWQQSSNPARYYIERLTNPGDLVVDPFLGSGTTAVAAVALGRRFIGCDIDEAAVEVARERLRWTAGSWRFDSQRLSGL